MSLSPATSRTCSRNHEAHRGPRPWEEPVFENVSGLDGEVVRKEGKEGERGWFGTELTARENDPFDVCFVGEFVSVSKGGEPIS